MAPAGLTRRAALRLSSVGVLGVGGCLAGGSRDTPSHPSSLHVADITTSYPDFGGHYFLHARSVANPEVEPIPFSELSPESRIEVACAITRAECLDDSPAFLQSEDSDRPITYQGAAFSVAVGVADGTAAYGPRVDPEWRAPVAFDGRIEDGSLDVTVTNELDAPLDIQHFGRPYFGVVTAVSDSPVLLAHDRYDENPFIQTTDIVQTDVAQTIEYQTETLAPGQSLRETYDLPDSLPENSTVRLSLPIYDPDVDMLGGRRVVVVAHLSLTTESDGDLNTS